MMMRPLVCTVKIWFQMMLGRQWVWRRRDVYKITSPGCEANTDQTCSWSSPASAPLQMGIQPSSAVTGPGATKWKQLSQSTQQSVEQITTHNSLWLWQKYLLRPTPSLGVIHDFFYYPAHFSLCLLFLFVRIICSLLFFCLVSHDAHAPRTFSNVAFNLNNRFTFSVLHFFCFLFELWAARVSTDQRYPREKN